MCGVHHKMLKDVNDRILNLPKIFTLHKGVVVARMSFSVMFLLEVRFKERQ